MNDTNFYFRLHDPQLKPILLGSIIFHNSQHTVQDAQGNNLARVLARRKTGLVKKYRTVACVRDVTLMQLTAFS